MSTAVRPTQSGQLSLSSLLEPSSWELPGWNESSATQAKEAPETLDRLDLSLALLSRYRNSLRPFNQLTPDILLLIFEELAREHYDPHDPHFGSYIWKGVAQVCHFWRDTALASPILWTQLNTQYTTAALACLERSAEAPLTLVISGASDNGKTSSLLEAIIPHVGRLRHLYVPSHYLKTSDGNIHQMLKPIVGSKAPQLETLQTVKFRTDGGPIDLPTLFEGHTPSLRRLKVHYMCPQIRSVSLSKLRVLSFCGRKHTPISMTVSTFLDLLQECPLLEYLKAEKTTFELAAENETRKLRLDNLRVLEVGRASASLVADIFSRLIIPDCAVRLKVWLDRYEDNKFHFGIPAEHTLEPTHHLRDIRKMHVNYMNGYEGVDILGATSTSPLFIQGYLESHTVNNLGDMDSIAGTVFQSLVKAFDLEALEEFAITEMRNNARWTGFTKKVWMDTFTRMPNLKALYVTLDGGYDEGFSRSILAALSTRDERSGGILCPQLEKLYVWGDKTWSSLQCYTMAEERAKSGHPLKRVSMRLSHYASFSDPSDTDLPLLRKFVETVDLDPTEIELPEFPALP